jgi:leucyl/phenylalanyl-tRNA--protein transferase
MQQRGIKIIDCQMHTEHLASFGASEIPFEVFATHLSKWCGQNINMKIGLGVIKEVI